MIKTKRWNEKVGKEDGFRLLVCRYRPRALPKDKENWTLWRPNLGPSKELHSAFYGKTGEAISWDEYRSRYFEEMKEQEEEIAMLAEMVAGGKTLTLLCSSACDDAQTCHRTLLKELIETRVAQLQTAGAGAVPPATV